MDGGKQPQEAVVTEEQQRSSFEAHVRDVFQCADDPNCVMFRYFEEDRFEVYAIKDIAMGDELLHTYRSLQWRKCFADLSAPVSGY